MLKQHHEGNLTASESLYPYTNPIPQMSEERKMEVDKKWQEQAMKACNQTPPEPKSTNNAFTLGYPAIEPAYVDGVLIHRREDYLAPGISDATKRAQATYRAKAAKRKAEELSPTERTRNKLAFIKPHGTGFDPKDRRKP